MNPDPTYPRQHGFAFAGYALDETNTPTFSYRSGDVTISDQTKAMERDPSQALRRTLKFSTKTATTLYFRALTGKIENPAKQVFKTPDIQIVLAPTETLLRPLADDTQELLLKLALPQGESTFTIDYIFQP